MTGTVIKVFGKYYTVYHDNQGINCILRGRLKQDDSLKKYSEPVVVGDRVTFDINDDGSGTIEGVEDRNNIFSRKDKYRSKEDIIAANLDQIVVIQSFFEPELNLRFVDRLLVRGEKEGIPVMLCVNKYDLAGRKDVKRIKSYYRGYPLEIVIVSARTGKGIKAFGRKIKGKLSILIGYSGVGKTSILNKLYPSLDLRTGDISRSTGKGKHTTTNVEMIMMEDGTRLIDTPGLREFGLMDIAPEELGEYFCEFRRYAEKCNFSPCTHDHEPGCMVKEQIDQGNISEDRYISYMNILNSLKEYYENRYR